MKKSLLTIVAFLFTTFCFAQFVASLSPSKLLYMPSVAFLKSNPQKIVGSDGRLIVKSNDGGKNFEILRDPISGCIKLQLLNDTTIILLDRSRFIFSNNDGKTWIDKYVVNNLGDTFIKEDLLINFNINENGKGFALAHKNKNKLNINSFTTNDFGETWELNDSNNINISNYNNFSYFNLKMYCFDTVCYLKKDLTVNKILIIKNNGANISEIDFEAKTGGEKFWNFAFKDALTGMFLTQKNEVYITTDGCVTFAKVTTPPNKCTIIDYAKSTPNKLGFWAIFNNNSNVSYFSLDSGATWKTMENFNSINNVDFFNAEIGIASSLNTDNRIMYFEGLPTSIKRIDSRNTISVYPNPATNKLNLVFEGNMPKNLIANIFDSKGSLVKSETIIDNEINITNLAQGLYLLSIESEGKRYNSKFVKE
jgi:hypothetical protein